MLTTGQLLAKAVPQLWEMSVPPTSEHQPFEA